MPPTRTPKPLGTGRWPKGQPQGERPARMPELEGPIDGDTVRQYRLWLGFTQVRLAAELGVSEHTLIAWEGKKRLPYSGAEDLRLRLYGHRARYAPRARYLRKDGQDE